MRAVGSRKVDATVNRDGGIGCDEMRQQAGSEQTGIYLQNSQCAGHSICTGYENVVTMMKTREYHTMMKGWIEWSL